MELTPAEPPKIESPSIESPDSNPHNRDVLIDDRNPATPKHESSGSKSTQALSNNETKLKLPNGDTVTGKIAKSDSLPEDSSKRKLPKGEVLDHKLTKGEPIKDERKDRNWKFLSAVVVILSLATLGFLAFRLIFRSKAEIFTTPDKIPLLTTAQIDRVIRSGVRLDEKLTLAYLHSKLSVTQFKSQDRKYTVFRIITPETCGKLGCLYIVEPEAEGISIPLQLEDIGVGKEMFKSSPKFHCFKVVQRQNGEDRNFEICEQGY
jgi:hypothetical protein